MAAVLIVPYREDSSGTRAPQLKAFTEHRAKVFPHASLLVVEQDDDGCPFNRGQLLNVGYRYLEEHTDWLEQKDARVVFHDVDLLPSAETYETYGTPFEEDGPNGNVRVVQAANSRYDGNGCFGGVTIFNRTGFHAAMGWSNRFWGWGGEDNCLYARCVAAGVAIERVSDREFVDLERDLLGIDTVQDKLRALDTAQRPTAGGGTARLAHATKLALLRSDRNKRGRMVWWPRDNWRACNVDVLRTRMLGDGDARAVQITVRLGSFKPGTALCAPCAAWKPEADFSKAQLTNYHGGSERGGLQGAAAANVIPQPGELGFARCTTCVASDPKATRAVAATCLHCGAEFASRTKLFVHLNQCAPAADAAEKAEAPPLVAGV